NAASYVIERGEPLLFHTHKEYLAYAAAHALAPLDSGEQRGEAVVFVPLSTGSRIVGVLSVESWQPCAYDEAALEILSIIASQAAVALENARMYAQSEEAIRQTQALLDVTRKLNSTHD